MPDNTGEATVVYWDDDSGRSRVVRGVCMVCHSYMRREYGVSITRGSAPIVSPSGLAHAGHDHIDGDTACGKDATGPDWWWKL